MALAADVVAAIARRLAEHAGLELPGWVIDARATARIAAIGGSPADYVALIDSARGAGELAALLEAVRVGESRLFRHRAQIDLLTTVFAPAMRVLGVRNIRVWSAGCAAGEEPYTLAMVLSRALPDRAIAIHATDVSNEAIARARTASFPRSALDHVPGAYRDCFVRDGDGVRVVPEIRALVDFQCANLIDRGPLRQYHLVWCRNVLIYFTSDARRAAIDTLVRATERDGFLFVGYSESLRDIDGLEARSAGDTVYYVRTGPDTSQRQRREPDRRYGQTSGGTRPSGDRTAPPVPADPTPPPVPADPTPLAASQQDRASSVLALRGQPTAAELTAEISARLAQPDLAFLTIDIDGAELLDDDLIRVLRRARAAAWTAGVEFGVDATRPGAVRWLNRHGFGNRETIIADIDRSRRGSGGNGPGGNGPGGNGPASGS